MTYEWTPYRSTYGALARAYETLSRDIVEISKALKNLRGGTVKIAPNTDFSAHDWIIQAVYVIAMMRQECSPIQRHAVIAYFAAPGNDRIGAEKELHTCLLADDLMVRLGLPESYRWYTVDVAREWAGGKRKYSDEWWSKHLGKTDRWLRVIKSGDASHRKRGIVPSIDRIFNSALGLLTDVYARAGIIPDVDRAS